MTNTTGFCLGAGWILDHNCHGRSIDVYSELSMKRMLLILKLP